MHAKSLPLPPGERTHLQTVRNGELLSDSLQRIMIIVVIYYRRNVFGTAGSAGHEF